MELMLTHLLSNLEKDPVEKLQPKVNNWDERGVLRRYDQDEFHDAGIFDLDGFDQFDSLLLVDQGFVLYRNPANVFLARAVRQLGNSIFD